MILYKTRFGLRLRAVGENPAAVDTAGISVVGLRYAAVGICGVLCGIAGAYMATALQAGFVKDMSAGRGFIALAALIFAKWRPWYALGACLLFGFFFAVDNRFQNILLPAWAMSGVLLALGCGLFAYVRNKTLLDRIVLGGSGLGACDCGDLDHLEQFERRSGQHDQDPGGIHPIAALCADCRGPRRLRRQGDSAPFWWGGLRQREIRPNFR